MLDKILEHKRDEISRTKKKYSVADLEGFAAEQGAARNFAGSLKARAGGGRAAVIAELKRASPSKGVLREDFNPIRIANSLMQAGACCLSVLTDVQFFKGSGAILDLVRRHCVLPVLRKDFILDPYQVHESRAIGADCVLLIAAAVPDDGLLGELFRMTRQLGMDALVEVHDRAELDRAAALGDELELIGINNRNLASFEVSLKTSCELAQSVDGNRLVISESGIHTREDIATLQDSGIHAYLIGETLMRATDPGAALRDLLQPNQSATA